MKMFFLVLAVVTMAGCAAVGPYTVSPFVYRSTEGQAAARRQAQRAYWQKQAESYSVVDAGRVASAPLPAPDNYHHGWLINQRNKPVIFIITGAQSLRASVVASSKAEAWLPPGTYWVELYEANTNYAYRSDFVAIDNIRGNAVIDVEVTDFFIVAP